MAHHCTPKLSQVLKSGNRTDGTDIVLNHGSSLISKHLDLQGCESASLSSKGTLDIKAKEDINLSTQGNFTQTVEGDQTNVGNNITNRINGNMTFEITGDFVSRVDGDNKLTTGSHHEVVKGDYELSVGGNYTIDLTGGAGDAEGADADTPASASASGPTLTTLTGGYNVVFKEYASLELAKPSTSGAAAPAPEPLPAGTFKVAADNIILDAETGVNIKAPLTTIQGDLVVTGSIKPSGAIPVAQAADIRPSLVSGGQTVVGDWQNRLFNVINDWNLEFNLDIDTGVLTLTDPGIYAISGFSSFFSVSNSVICVTRFTALDQEPGVQVPVVTGSNVYGTGSSILDGIVRIEQATPFALQYRTSAAQIDGLGQASGLAPNTYASLTISKLA